MTNVLPGQHCEVASVPNLRDLGGWKALGNRHVRPASVYRSTELYRLGGEDVPKFDRLGIRTVYDLRTAGERSAAPDPEFDGVTDLALDVLADSATALPANFGSLLGDRSMVAKVSEALGDGRGVDLMVGTYRQIVSLPSALAAYRSLFTGLAGEHATPSLFHCTTGKDRTGWAAAALLSILGVGRSDVYRDYLLTNDQLLPALHPVFAGFEAAGGDPHVLRPVLGVEKVYLDAAFEEMEQRYGTIEGYFIDGLGLEERSLERLREQLLIPD